MCKFCKETAKPEGARLDDAEDIVFDTFPEDYRDSLVGLQIRFYDNGYDEDVTLGYRVWFGDDSEVINGDVPVRFCPFCGRSFKKKDGKG